MLYKKSAVKQFFLFSEMFKKAMSHVLLEHHQGTELHNLMVRGQDRPKIMTTINRNICQGWGLAGTCCNNCGETQQRCQDQCPEHTKQVSFRPKNQKGVHPATSVVLGVCPLSTTEGSRTLLFSLVVSYSLKILCTHFEKEVSLSSTTTKLGWV